MVHTNVAIVTATREQPCALCGVTLRVGERVEYIKGPPRSVQHVVCGLRERRSR